MIKKLLCLLVLLLTATTGAWAQAQTYKVTLQEGTEDADNWTVPTEAAEGTTVTATYSGEKKVKSVKAVKKEVIKPDLLSGVFSVSASKKVNFSKGNLQATYDGSSWTWAFANNQWDYIGNSAGNTKVTDASPFISENGTVDLFGWVGASSTWDGVNQYGITSSNARNATNGYGNSATENLKNDWGTLMGTGWRTLTKDEWAYMLNSRSGTSYCKAQVNSKSGLVIFPDGYSHPTGPTAPTKPLTAGLERLGRKWKTQVVYSCQLPAVEMATQLVMQARMVPTGGVPTTKGGGMPWIVPTICISQTPTYCLLLVLIGTWDVASVSFAMLINKGSGDGSCFGKRLRRLL